MYAPTTPPDPSNWSIDTIKRELAEAEKGLRFAKGCLRQSCKPNKTLFWENQTGAWEQVVKKLKTALTRERLTQHQPMPEDLLSPQRDPSLQETLEAIGVINQYAALHRPQVVQAVNCFLLGLRRLLEGNDD